MRKFLLLILGLFFCQTLLSQVTFPESERPKNDSLEIFKNVNVNQDSVLLKLVKWHVEDNKKRNGIDGFRVEVFSSRELEVIEKTKIEFLSKYPSYPVYVKFIAPIFKIRIGDFRTKSEALKLYKEIEGDYRSAFIVKDKINFPTAKKTIYE